MNAPRHLRRIGALLSLTIAGCSAPLTHTALDLTPFGAIFSAVGLMYWLVSVGALLLAAMLPKAARDKGVALLVVVALFGYLPITGGWDIYKARTRLAKAEAMFQERCKTAGEKIHRTAENVDGIFLMKVRPEVTGAESYDQFGSHDPYGHDSGGDGYIKSFSRGYHDHSTPDAPGVPPRLGYRYIEAIDPKDGKRYRYTGSIKVVGRKEENAPNIQIELKRSANFDLNIYAFVLDKVPAPGPSPRYGVTYNDISTHDEREYWIAGSSLKVVDLQTNEIMAERIGYMMDRGQGVTGGGRAPWLHAANSACPTFQRNPYRPIPAGQGASAQANQADDFVEKVLKPNVEK